MQRLLMAAIAVAVLAGWGPNDPGGDIALPENIGATGTTILDDVVLCWGTGCKYWYVYNSGTGQFELWSTDTDGGGTDDELIEWNDGTDDAVMSGGLELLTGPAVVSSDANGVCVGAAGTACTDGRHYFDGTDWYWLCPGCTNGIKVSAPLILGTIEIKPDSGAMTLINMQFTTTPADGTEQSYTFALNSANVFKVWGEADGSGGIDEKGYQFFGMNGSYKHCTRNQKILTFAANPGDASKITSGLIPDGATDIGITTRTLVTGTNCSDVDYGDGTSQNLYGDAIALTAGTTTNSSDFTANIQPNAFIPEELKITGTDGAGGLANCYDLSVRIEAYYCTYVAPTN
jgi:hypothetical protein